MSKTIPNASKGSVRSSSLLQDDHDHVPLYVRLGRLMRQNILTGVWDPGMQIPPIPELCREFGISRPSVRQAIALLVKDELVTSTRGRGTFVTDHVASLLNDDSLRISISDPLAMGTTQTIKVLGRKKHSVLPKEIETSDPQDPPYVAIEKTHGYRNKPFMLARIYVAQRLYSQLPKGSDGTYKIVPLLREYTGVRPIKYRQEIAIMHAAEETAQILGVPAASSIVQIRRWWTDETGRIGWASLGHYRSDMFVLDVTLEDAGGNLLSLISPGVKATPLERQETEQSTPRSRKPLAS